MEYETIALAWQGIPFTLAFTPDYCGAASMAHMEVRCDEPLPITETGYKSIFIRKDTIPDITVAAALLQDHMTRVAKTTGWHADRQLALF